MVRSSVSRISSRGFSLVLSGVLLLMIVGLVVTDRAISRARAERAQTDAAQSALAVEEAMVAPIEGLNMFGALLVAPRPTQRLTADFGALTTAFSQLQPGTRRITLFDTAGLAVLDTVLEPDLADSPVAPLEVLTDAQRSRITVIAAQSGRPRVVAIVRTAIARRRLGGWAVALVDADSLFRHVLAQSPPWRDAIAVVAGQDTIAVAGHRATLGGSSVASSTIMIPNDQHWTLIVSHEPRMEVFRGALWTLGLMTVALLGAGVLREQRQANRIAERSAELERLYREVARANTAKSEFLANVSHELRTPLTAIVGFVELLKDGVYGEITPRQIPPVDRISVSATHLRHLVDQVLDLAKIAAGRMEVHSETLVLRTFVLNVASELESLVNERGLSFSIAVGATLPRVRTDPTHLRQILVNLIGNAVKYTSIGGIAIRGRLVSANGTGRLTPEDPALVRRAPDARRNWVALQVIDSGAGIAPDDHERIFDEFEQVNAGPRGESMQRGTGLGLPISRRLARLLGGDIGVESQPGKGSTFTIWIPIHPSDLESPRVRPAGEGQAVEA
jgi:signal transduction histidine kinase